MSERDLLRINTVKNIINKLLSKAEGARILKVSERHLRRLVNSFLKEGPSALISNKCNKPSNNCISEVIKSRALEIIQEDYYDYGPTLAAEKLDEYNGISLSKETARNLMIDADIWKPRHKREPKIHPRRPRRPCIGELIQIDGSPHAWFEDRAPECTLLVFIDDATSKLMKLLFVESESTINYFKILKDYLRTYGKPLSFYSDRHVVFKINNPEAKTGTGLTQYGRATTALNINRIYARSAQAKGRVERANLTLQDRLVKELRLRNISTMEEANNFLEEYRESHNKRFAKPPRSEVNIHRPLSSDESKNLDIICSVQTKRTMTKNLEIRHNKALIQVKAPGKVRRLARVKVLVCEDTQGKLTVLHNNKPLQFEVYSKTFREDHILDEKEINSYLDKIMLDWQPVGGKLKPRINTRFKKQTS